MHEKFNALFMDKCFTEEELATIRNEFEDFYLAWLPQNFEALSYVSKFPKEHTHETYTQHMDTLILDFSTAVRVSYLDGNTWYSEQYAKEGALEYYFLPEEYDVWQIKVHEPTELAEFTLSGKVIPYGRENQDYYPIPDDFKYDLFESRPYWFQVKEQEIKTIKNEKYIEGLLKEKGISEVRSMKFVSRGSYELRALYLNTDKGEYMILLNSTNNKSAIDGIELFKLYTAAEMMEAFRLHHAANKETSKMYEKPVYETEALALKSDGLLYGNERGLDLLKPLTRIEAAAILLRAMGINVNETQVQAQTFSDVATSHWGYSVAETAYDTGLIRGVGENMFAPDKRVSATEFGTMVLRAANTGEFNWEEAVDILVSRGILTEENIKYMDFFTRGDMAKIIYEARAHGLF